MGVKLLAKIKIHEMAKEMGLTSKEIIEKANELGIEAKFDNELKGIDGYLKYEQDRFGYKKPDTAETRIEAQDGKDIYS